MPVEVAGILHKTARQMRSDIFSDAGPKLKQSGT